ncbi:MAG: CCA tRNA nucleotidyltransferase [Cyanobium sp.]
MPTGSHQAPILSRDPGEQLRSLWRTLAPQRWPLDTALLPAETLLVGGAVRDALLGRLRERPDLDLVVEGDAIALTRSLARRCGGSCVVLDAERSIARLVVRGWSFDLARRMGASTVEDLARRDYSINAIALPLGTLALAADPMATADWSGPLDPAGGLADLQAGRMRALGESNLLEDPLRLLRGVRLACELGFTLEPRTLAWIRTHHRRLEAVAGERVLAELERLAAAPNGAEGLGLALELGLLEGWCTDGGAGEQESALRRLRPLTPERARQCGLSAAEGRWALPLARLAAVLTAGALERLRGSRRLQQRCRRLRHWLERLEADQATPARDGTAAGALSLAGLPEMERLTLQREMEEDLPALALHLPPGSARGELERWRDPADPLFHPRPPLDGGRLQQELGLEPGQTLGLLLAHLTRERAFGRLADPDATDQALDMARAWLAIRSADAADRGERGRAT